MTSIATAAGRLEQIGDALAAAPEGDFAAAAGRLLAALGYRSERILTGQSGAAAELVASNADTRSKADFIAAARSARVLFQVTDAEISGAAAESLFADRDFADFADPQSSFIFAVVELADNSYPRGRYAAFTREINKRFQAPAVLLFRTASGRLTLAFVHRRENRRDPQRDALGSVFLLREIDPARPHRAHLEILGELALPQRLAWLRRQGRAANFAGLLAAWLDALDTEELNRRFYRELFGWFERAVAAAKFPAGRDGSIPKEEQVIRLITRLLFVWFIKEKGLIAADLFVEHQVAGLLKDYDREQGDSYYRAVLQNLFFATLNTEIRRRGFSSGNNNTHRDFSLYRYRPEITDADRLLQLFARTPFINGGLFDCLDSTAAAGAGGYRVDCFTDNALRPGRAEYGILSVPNRLFFAGESRREREPGLIDLFNRYKFTVEENTPAEQEVALDPELLGKVFENLLAAYNPETRETARKQTGSYYTPRAVVDYMVEEALVAALAEKLAAASGEKEGAADRESRLRWLLDYADADADDAGTLFSDAERAAIVAAIAQLKVLDPAVGSGAFPMGILHKLTLALRRLDGDNSLWEGLQKDLAGRRATAAFDTARQTARDAELKEISATFERYRASDFGRKLYLIQNSVFGVDRQTAACQIAKLRFFISLAIEQEPTADPADNYGIRPLPNLETRFVAADTLRGLGGLNRQLVSPETERLYQQLAENRERHFHATIRADKLRCRRADERLRGQLADSLRTDGLAADHADKVAHWDPYDQNAAADWFDPGYMFGVREGFDVVIGNPPYVESRNSLLSDELKGSYGNQVLADWGDALPRGSDLLIYFYARAPKLLNDAGLGCFITQNAWLSTDYGHKFQGFSIGKFSFQKIIDSSARFFSDAQSQNINAVITVFTKRHLESIEYGVADGDMSVATRRVIAAKQEMKWGHIFAMPSFYADIFTGISARPDAKESVAFGQGLNFPLSHLNSPGAQIPVIVKDSRFVAFAADGKVETVNPSRKDKVPALIMPRGVGRRHYCTLNLCKAFSYSGVEVYLPQELWEADIHYCLWAYLNSSFVWLFREITGRKNLGGGLLKAEATDMKLLPIDLGFDFAEDAKKVIELLKNREPKPVSEEVYTEEHLLIDDMVARYFGFADLQENIRQVLIEQVNFRMARARR